MQNPFRSTTFQVHFHKWATLAWIALTIPTLLVWKESILWVALMSVWANIAAHWSAFEGAAAKAAQEEEEREKSD
jgi:hypothetical protein